jgi:DNA-binding transcriptional ArsR family regulator
VKAYRDVAGTAALIGEPARAVILLALLDGRPLTASNLAARVDLAPSTTSEHLRRLVAGGLLIAERRGRHRDYRLAGREVAQALEALGALSGPGPTADDDAFEREVTRDLRFARSCFDHLAGRLGVAITDALLARRCLVEDGDDYRLTAAGEAWFAAFGVDVAAARGRRRRFARRCLDWSERRPHLAGALGTALFAELLARGWVERLDGERVLRLTPRGAAGLAATFGWRSAFAPEAPKD